MSLARLTQLFAVGSELVLEPLQEPGSPPATPVVLWIAKLNAFQEEQANQAGRVARARLVNAIREIGSPEWDLIQARKGDALTSALILSIVQSKESELFVKASNEIMADEDWRERIEMIQQTDPKKISPMELEAHKKLSAEYNAHLLDLHQQKMDDLKHELSEMTRADVEEHFEEAYLYEQGLAAFGMERSRHHLYLCMRDCQATPPRDNERWDHSSCDHEHMFLANVEEVDRLPQAVRDQVEHKYGEIAMSPATARFTDALASSSESPEPSGKEADSTPSGPVATSPAQATT